MGHERQPGIDLLRVIAALFVLLFHYFYLFPGTGEIEGFSASPVVQRIVAHGYLGVEVFFIISGYVITISAEPRTRAHFIYARFVRLWPAFLICMILTAITLMIEGKELGGFQILANLTMLPHLLGQPYIDSVYWSLMFEIIFYAAICALVVGLNFRTRVRAFACVWLGLSAISAVTPFPTKLHTLLVLGYGPYFCVGIAIFLLRRFGNRPIDLAIGSGAVILSTIWAYIGAENVGRMLEFGPNPIVSAIIVAIAAAAVYLAPAVRMQKTAQLAIALGGISYPLYLLHARIGTSVIRLINPITANVFLSIVIVTLSVFLLSAIVWRVEFRIRTWLRAMAAIRAPTRSAGIETLTSTSAHQ